MTTVVVSFLPKPVVLKVLEAAARLDLEEPGGRHRGDDFGEFAKRYVYCGFATCSSKIIAFP